MCYTVLVGLMRFRQKEVSAIFKYVPMYIGALWLMPLERGTHGSNKEKRS